mgnify:CR=1 FL=1
MKKTFLIVLISVLALSLTSGVEIKGNDKILKGENLVIKISGNFYEPLVKEDIKFYRRHLPTSFGIIDLIKFEDDYYFFILIQNEKEVDNYSIVLDNVKEKIGDKIIQSSPYFNFSILEERASFSIVPGILFAEKNYTFEMKNLENKEIEIQYYFDDFSEEFFEVPSGEEINNTESKTFSFWDLFKKPTGVPEKENISEGDGKIILKSGEIKQITFETKHKGFKEIAFVHDNKYQKILIYSYLDEIPEEINNTETIEEEEEEKGNFWDLFKKKEDNSTEINESEDINVSLEDLETCSEMKGEVCNKTSTCSGEREYAQDGLCCLGSCVHLPDKNNGKIIGWILIIIVLLSVSWFFKSKFSKTRKSSVNLEKEIQKSNSKK